MSPLRGPSAFFAAAGLVLVVLARCGGELGSDTAGKNGLSTTYGFNVVTISPDKRRTITRFGGVQVRRDQPAVSSAIFRGRVGVINLWGSWCAPCRREEPALESVWKQYREKGVRFLGVNVLDNRGDAIAFLDEFGVTYPSVYNRDALIAFKLRVRFMPTTFVVDRRGRIAARITGALRERADLSRLLDGLLKSP